MEFSDTSQLHPPHYSLSNQSTEKENQPHPLPLERHQSSKLQQSCLQPHPISTTEQVDQPRPSSTAQTRYYKLVKEYLAKNNKRHGMSRDAWTLACEHFSNLQPHPINTAVDWLEFIK